MRRQMTLRGKELRKHLWTTLCFGSLALCVASTVLWARSYRTGDLFICVGRGVNADLLSAQGRIAVAASWSAKNRSSRFQIAHHQRGSPPAELITAGTEGFPTTINWGG